MVCNTGVTKSDLLYDPYAGVAGRAPPAAAGRVEWRGCVSSLVPSVQVRARILMASKDFLFFIKNMSCISYIQW